MAKSYLPYTVSRTLDPKNKGLATILGRHDRRLSDADINLIQDTQDSKRRQILDTQIFSGCLSITPFTFLSTPYTLEIPAFDIISQGEVLNVRGNRSTDMSKNLISIPGAPDGSSSTLTSAIYVVYLEYWNKGIDPELGTGYYDDAGTYKYYPEGNVDADPANMILDDTQDPFTNIYTTYRVQKQWAIRVAKLPNDYNFTDLRLGLDPTVSGAVMGRGSIDSQATPSSYGFSSMGPVTGDYGLWRAGNGDPNNALGTVDGFTYAMPIAIVSQRNSGAFDISSNPMGCGKSGIPASGSLGSGVSGRYDGKFYDAVIADDVIDTRLRIFLEGHDYTNVIDRAFTDLVTGKTRLKIARGETPGGNRDVVGSRLNYNINFGPNEVANSDRPGGFDGFRGGFATSPQTFRRVFRHTTLTKATGTVGVAWAPNDTVLIDLATSGVAKVQVTNITVQTLVRQSNNSLVPVTLLGGQYSVTGLNTKSVVVKLNSTLFGTSYDPLSNPLIVTADVYYPSGGNIDTRRVPDKIDGGYLSDSNTNESYNVFGCSTYKTREYQTAQSAKSVQVVNPEYSNSIFGTIVEIEIGGSNIFGTSGGDTYYSISRTNLDGRFLGHHVGFLYNPTTSTYLTITRRFVSTSSIVVATPGNLPSSLNLRAFVVCEKTAQISYNPAIKGVVAIEEVLRVTKNGANSRITVDSYVYDSLTNKNYITLSSNKCQIKGVSGEVPPTLTASPTLKKFVWVRNSLGDYEAIAVDSVAYTPGVVVITVPGTVNLVNQDFYVLLSLYVTPDAGSRLFLSMTYTPYQGEGVGGRDYAFLEAGDEALVTTNGTGTAPIIGIADVFPFRREVPLATMMPSRDSWLDSDLKNSSLAVGGVRNYEAKRGLNVEHTIGVPIFNNDYFKPVFGAIRKKVRLENASARGFSSVSPSLGFAIQVPKTRDVLGDSLEATVADVTIFVNNVAGDDLSDGFSPNTAKKTILAAINVLPPVLRHVVSIVLVDTGTEYEMKNFTIDKLSAAQIGEGGARTFRYYSLADLSFTTQRSGKLVITKQPEAISPIVITYENATPYGDGETNAFFIQNARVQFNGVKFKKFINPAIRAFDSDINFVDCVFEDNQTGIAVAAGSTVVLNNTRLQLGDGHTGCVLNSSTGYVVGGILGVDTAKTPNSFFTISRNSSITMASHDVTNNVALEVNVSSSTYILKADLGSSVYCEQDWGSNGKSRLETNTVLSRPTSKIPFFGGIETDATSNVAFRL